MFNTNDLKIRKAHKEDVPFIVSLLAEDKLGKQRECFTNPLPSSYYNAFESIDQDDHQELVVAMDNDNSIVATLHLTFIPSLTYQGGIRAQIEAVRVRADQRKKGIGKLLFEWAIQRARDKGAHIVQLTTDKQRPEALIFYRQLGFSATHEGMKLHL